MSVYVKLSAYSFVVHECNFQFSTLIPLGRYISSCSSELGFWFLRRRHASERAAHFYIQSVLHTVSATYFVIDSIRYLILPTEHSVAVRSISTVGQRLT
jgi:hypothetical protein